MKNREIASCYGLGAGIAAVSFGAVFARLADAPAPAVAALRMIFSSLLIAPFALGSASSRRELGGISRRSWSALFAAGGFLALHFILWIASLSRTAVASSVVLVTTSPLWVAGFSILVLRERVPRIFWLGIAIACGGGAVIGGGDLAGAGGRWQGNLLAIGGAVALAGYFLVGSRLRRRLSLVSYVFAVYTIAGLALVGTAFAARVSILSHGPRTYLYCFLMACVCQVLGHSLFNWALARLPATVVAISSLGEPVGATILAWLILREIPAGMEVIGGAMILVGIALVLVFVPAGGASPKPARSGS